MTSCAISPECAPGTDRGIVGDAVASGLHAAVLATTGRATSAAVETALRLACTGPRIGVLAGRLTRNFPTTGAAAGSR